MDATSISLTSDVTRGAGAYTARQMKRTRALIPKSADASSPQRRNTGRSHPQFARTFSIPNENATAGDVKSATQPEGITHRRLNLHLSQQHSARPWSTRMSPRSISHCISPNQAMFSDQQSFLQADSGVMQNENEHLRREISLLQQKLVEKIRGSPKILVSGGQFRAFVSSPHAKEPGKNHVTRSSTVSAHVQACDNCDSLRASFKTAREIAGQEQRALALRISQLERDETDAQAIRTQQEKELSSLRQRFQQMVANDVVARDMMRGQHDELRQLREAMARLVKEKTLRMQETAPQDTMRRDLTFKQKHEVESQTEDTIQCSSISVQLQRSQHELEDVQRQLQLSLESNDKSQASVLDLRGQLSTLEMQYAERVLLHTNKQKCVQEELKHAKTELSSLRSQNLHLQEKVSTLETALQAIEASLTKSQTANSENIAVWEHQLTAKEDQLALLQLRAAQSDALTETTQHRVAELEAVLLKVAEENGILAAQARNAGRELEEVREVVKEKAEEVCEHKKLCEDNQAECSKMREQLQRTQTDLVVSQNEVSSLQKAFNDVSARLAAANAEITAREQIQRRVQKSHAAALEKAMQSVIRLCVVAPTVNVHLSNSVGGAAGTTSVIACKATLPHKQVRAVVEQDVLPLFSAVFVQTQEHSSPKGGALDPWLQVLLRDMQESLAIHLQKLYSAATPAD